MNSTIASSCIFGWCERFLNYDYYCEFCFSGGVRCYFNYYYYHELCFSGWRARFSNTIIIVSFAFSWAVCAAMFYYHYYCEFCFSWAVCTIIFNY